MSAAGLSGQAWGSLVVVAFAAQACAKALPPLALPAFADISPTPRPFVGCWVLTMAQPLPDLGMTDRLTVWFDTVVVEKSQTEVALRARSLAGFTSHRVLSDTRLIWLVRPGADTVVLSTESVSGAMWALEAHGDSLVGETHLFFDVGRTDVPMGAARAHRAICDA